MSFAHDLPLIYFLILAAAVIFSGFVGFWFARRLGSASTEKQSPDKTLLPSIPADVVMVPDTTSQYQEIHENQDVGLSKPEILAPTRYFFGDQSQPLVEIERFPAVHMNVLKPLALSTDVLSKYAPFLQHAPSLAVSAAFASSPDLYAVTFSPEILAQIDSGALHLVQSKDGGLRAIAAGDNGFVEHGNLHSIEGLQLATFAAISWGVLSILTAQLLAPVEI